MSSLDMVKRVVEQGAPPLNGETAQKPRRLFVGTRTRRSKACAACFARRSATASTALALCPWRRGH